MMNDMIEAVARAICKADDCNPDQRTTGLGRTMPEGKEYALWEARVKQARAAIIAYEMFNLRSMHSQPENETYGPEPKDKDGITMEQFLKALENMAETYEKYKDR